MNDLKLLGNISSDIEMKQTDSGLSIAKFGIAVRRDKNNTDFFNITAFGKTAEAIAKFFEKGNKILLSCRIHNNNYERDGKTIYSNQIICNSFYFAGSNAKQSSDELPF